MSAPPRPTGPRERRDTLFLLALIAATVAPHLPSQPPGVTLLCLAVLGWRALLAWRQAPLPGAALRLGVVAAAAGLTWLHQGTLLGRDAGITLLVMLMALKTLELRARRDAMVVFFLGFFLILTQFLHGQSPLAGLAMVTLVWGWLTALTLAHMPAGHPPLREAAATALRAAVLGLPLMLLLFVLFPRLPPLWGMPAGTARTGLSEQLSLGQVAELAQDDSIALRLRFAGPAPAARALYLRGPVLSDYDGKTWRAPPLPRIPLPGPRARAGTPDRGAAPTRWDYEITLEPLRIAWLPLLEYTAEPPRTEPPLPGLVAPQDDSVQWRLQAPLGQRVRLQARAQAERPPAAALPAADRERLTRLPPQVHPRTRAWARALRERPEAARDPQAFVEAVLRHLRQGGYSYTLSPGPYEGDTVDEFWLDRRLGFCEHYASSFVVVLRSVGIPARLVTGYQGADPTPVDGEWVVRQSHAHAWAEYWRPGAGWQRVDPTAAVNPERISRSRQLEAPAGLVMGTLETVSPGLRQQLRRWRETMEQRWNRWVVGYGAQQQLRLLADWSGPHPDPALLWRLLVLCLAGLGLAGAAWAAWDQRRQAPWPRLQGRLLRRLATRGVTGTAQDSPGRLAERLRAQHGDPGEAAAQLLEQLQAWRYAPAPPAWRPGPWWRRFRAATADLPRR